MSSRCGPKAAPGRRLAREAAEARYRAQGQQLMWHRALVLPRWARFKLGAIFFFYRINSVFMPGAADTSRRPFSVA